MHRHENFDMTRDGFKLRLGQGKRFKNARRSPRAVARPLQPLETPRSSAAIIQSFQSFSSGTMMKSKRRRISITMKRYSESMKSLVIGETKLWQCRVGNQQPKGEHHELHQWYISAGFT